MARTEETMIVTKQWLIENQSGPTSWTYAQLEVLGVSLPPVKGWIQAVVGMKLTDDQVAQFMRAKNIRCRKVKKIMKRSAALEDQQELF